MNPEDEYGNLLGALRNQRPGLRQQVGQGQPGDMYDNPASARVLGAWGPKILASARAVHARELAQQMLQGGV